MGIHESYILPAIMDVALAAIKEDRRALVANASGRVLELGIGNGTNLPFYTSRAERICGLEPNQVVLNSAQERLRKIADAGELPLGLEHFEFVNGGAEKLDFPDGSFDTVIACLVFCTIPDNEAAAREAFRVLKPGGKLLFLEHVHYPEGGMQKLQNFLNPAWKVFACGCHLNRDTESVFREAGFEFEQIRRDRNPRMSPPFAAYMISGSAVKPA